MVIYTGIKVFLFRCTACDWEEHRTTGPSLLDRLFPRPELGLPAEYREKPVKNERCPKCGGSLTRCRLMVHS